MTPLLQAEALSKVFVTAYGEIPAVEDLSLSVAPGIGLRQDYNPAIAGRAFAAD
jgi:hypothetical protein